MLPAYVDLGQEQGIVENRNNSLAGFLKYPSEFRYARRSKHSDSSRLQLLPEMRSSFRESTINGWQQGIRIVARYPVEGVSD